MVKRRTVGKPGELAPEISKFLRDAEALGGKAMVDMSPEEARQSMRDGCRAIAGDPVDVADVHETRLPGPGGDIVVRLYTPEGQAPFPVVVFFHGGGWVVGDLNTHDHICRKLADRSQSVVASVDYRLAPENRFPAAADDCLAALQWVAENAPYFQGDPGRMAVVGDSAGGNLAAVACIMARDNEGPELQGQVLIYPVTDLQNLDTATYRQYAEGYSLTKKDMEWFVGQYLVKEEDSASPAASPLLADSFGGLPAAHFVFAECDVLRAEGEAYAKKLDQAGVPVSLTCYNGMIHGFWGMERVTSMSDIATDEVARRLRSMFTHSGFAS